MDVTVVTGVPGVGTSHVCREARRSLEDGYELINVGDVMLEQAVTQGMVSDRDDLATLSRREIRLLQRRAGEYVAERARSKALLVNTHLAVATDHGFLAGLPRTVRIDVGPDRIVLVEADPATISERRSSVDHRVYRESGIRAIDLHQDLNRAAAMQYAVNADVAVRLVENEGDLEAAVAALVQIVTESDPAH